MLGILAGYGKFVSLRFGYGRKLQDVSLNRKVGNLHKPHMAIVCGSGFGAVSYGDYVVAGNVGHVIIDIVLHAVEQSGIVDFGSVGLGNLNGITDVVALCVPGNALVAYRNGNSVGIPDGIQHAVFFNVLIFIFIGKLLLVAVLAYPPAEELLAFRSKFGQIVKLAVHGLHRADLLFAVHKRSGKHKRRGVLNEFSINSYVTAFVYVEIIRFRASTVREPAHESITFFDRSVCGGLNFLSVFNGRIRHSGAAVQLERNRKGLVLQESVFFTFISQGNFVSGQRSGNRLSVRGIDYESITFQVERSRFGFSGNYKTERRAFERHGVFGTVNDAIIACSLTLSGIGTFGILIARRKRQYRQAYCD